MADDDERPNPEEYKVHMRTAHASEDSAMRHNDFVGAYNHTGRVKLEKKKWNPAQKPDADDNVFRADDWMGSGKTQRKSWKVKSSSNVVKADDSSKPGDFISSNSESSGRKWKPPSRDQTVPPPWMASPSQSSPTKRASTSAKWKPRSHPSPVNASDHTKETSEHEGNMSLSELQNSNHSNVKDAIERLSNSFSHHSVTSSPRHSPRHSPRRAWQSHGALPKVDISLHGDDVEGTEPLETAPKVDDNESEVYESASDDDDKPGPAKREVEAMPAPATPTSVGGHIVDDDTDKPNPDEYKIQMRTAHAGEDSAMRHNDYVGAYSNTGRVKLEKKKWTPTQKPDVVDNAFRSDDWMGSGKTQRKSWKPKSTRNVVRADDAPTPEFVRSKSENTRQWAPHSRKEEAATQAMQEPKPEPVKEQESAAAAVDPSAPATAEPPVGPGPAEVQPPETITENEATVAETTSVPSSTVSTDGVPSSTAPAPAPAAAGYMAGDDYNDDRPNPEEYKVLMHTVHAGEDSATRHHDYVGAYNHTGRIKLEKKKWTPSKKPEAGDNAFRVDDWMGSGSKKTKSWKVKK